MIKGIEIFEDISKNKEKTYYAVDSSGKKVYLYSKFNPSREIEKVFSAVYDRKANYYILLGIGDCRLAEKILSKDKRNIVIGVEYIKGFEKYQEQLKKKYPENFFYTYYNEKIKDFFRKFILINNFFGFKLHYMPVYLNLDIKINSEIINLSKIIYETEKRFLEVMLEIGRDYLTKCVLDDLWLENINRNIPNIFKYPQVKELKNAADMKYSCLIIMPGASLNNQIEEIKKYQNDIFIICVDTVLRTLIFNGIEPDIVVSVDGQRENFKDFTGVTYKNILVTDLLAYPEIFNLPESKKIWSITGHLKQGRGEKEIIELHPLIESLLENINSLGYLQAGGSVSTVALYLACYMRFSNIALLGFDCAYTDNKIYSKGSYIEQGFEDFTKFNSVENYFSDRLHQDGLIKIKQNEKEYITNPQMLNYKIWFEEAIAKLKLLNYNIVNATYDGLILKNVETQTLSHFCGKYKKKLKLDYEKFKVCDFKLKNINKILNHYNSILKKIEEIKCAEDTFSVKINKLYDIILSENLISYYTKQELLLISRITQKGNEDKIYNILIESITAAVNKLLDFYQKIQNELK